MEEKRNTNNNNKGRVVVVTGSSRGIGKAIAAEFANAGYSVVINARSEEELNQVLLKIFQSITKMAQRLSPCPGMYHRNLFAYPL